jgi:pyruvate dehydrogenase (quinone)
MEGDPKYEASQTLPDFPYARYAQLLGLEGIRVDDPAHIGDAWDDALAADRPALVEAIVDPEVPPLPPHITLEQAKNFSSALLRDPSRVAMLRQSMKEVIDSFTR